MSREKRACRPVILLMVLLFPCAFLRCQGYEPSTFIFPPFWATIGFHKVTQTEISMFLNGIRLQSPQGIAVTRLTSQDDPSTVSDDDELTGYAVDSGINLMGYNPTLTSAEVYGRPEKNEETFREPHGVRASPEGSIYVADTGNRRVVILYNNNGKLSFQNAIYGFSEPYDVSFDKKRDLYITDRSENSIKVYDNHFILKQTIKADRMVSPTGIMVVDSKDIWHYYKEDFLIVICQARALLKFTLSGELIKSVDLEARLNEKVKLEYVTADYYSQILVTDSRNSTIHKLDRDLNYITSFGRFGTKDFEFIEPRGIDIWRRFGQLMVTEQTGGQYFWVGTDIKDLLIQTSSSNCRVSYLLTEPAFLTAALFRNKELARTIMTNEKVLTYQNSFSFKLADDKGRVLNKGEYRLLITADPTYSSRKVFKKVIEKKIQF